MRTLSKNILLLMPTLTFVGSPDQYEWTTNLSLRGNIYLFSHKFLFFNWWNSCGSWELEWFYRIIQYSFFNHYRLCRFSAHFGKFLSIFILHRKKKFNWIREIQILTLNPAIAFKVPVLTLHYAAFSGFDDVNFLLSILSSEEHDWVYNNMKTNSFFP